MKKCSERPVMINRERVNASLDVGEVLQKKRSHISINLRALGNRQISTSATPYFLAFLASCRLGKSAQGKAVSDIPSNARQLDNAIGRTCDKVRKSSSHAISSEINHITYIRLKAPTANSGHGWS